MGKKIVSITYAMVHMLLSDLKAKGDCPHSSVMLATTDDTHDKATSNSSLN